ncbi:hypothetical protein K466DRAFT_136291 [Polyporus arcularius HHB13444]|uniref:Uncharacterized protein n=1 Tax=Polyporus arcularius HHB13444 TaxID=1314778 RepID=A0A5C3PF40_9APHY|nr:hypothetical protein K466DRAFT_136291 [Polyporus arcularius HHB13444]
MGWMGYFLVSWLEGRSLDAPPSLVGGLLTGGSAPLPPPQTAVPSSETVVDILGIAGLVYNGTTGRRCHRGGNLRP